MKKNIIIAIVTGLIMVCCAVIGVQNHIDEVCFRVSRQAYAEGYAKGNEKGYANGHRDGEKTGGQDGFDAGVDILWTCINDNYILVDKNATYDEAIDYLANEMNEG